MHLPIRQYRCHPLLGQDHDESDFGHVHGDLGLDPMATAFAAVDPWNMSCEQEPRVPKCGRYWGCGYLGVERQTAGAIREAVGERLGPVPRAGRAAATSSGPPLPAASRLRRAVGGGRRTGHRGQQGCAMVRGA